MFQTQETPMHYCARAGNADVLLEMVKHVEPNKVQNVINQQAKAWTNEACINYFVLFNMVPSEVVEAIIVCLQKTYLWVKQFSEVSR